MKKFVKKHKTVVIVGSVCLGLAILMFIAIFGVFFGGNSGNVFGDRLNNAPVVQTNLIENIRNDLEGRTYVRSVTFNQSVRILRFVVIVEDETELEDAQKLAYVIAEKLTTTLTSFYDVEVMLAMDGESSDYPSIGYKRRNNATFSWSNRGE